MKEEKAIDRLYIYMESKGIKPAQAERYYSLSNGYLSKQKKRGGDLGESVLFTILDNSPDLSPMWLLTGEGKMLVSDIDIDYETRQPWTNHLDNRILSIVEHYRSLDIVAQALRTTSDVLGPYINRNTKAIGLDYEPSIVDLHNLLNELTDINPTWLLLGEGEMLVKKNHPQQKLIEEVDGQFLSDIEEYNKAKEIGLSLIPEFTDTFRGGEVGNMISTDTIKAYWALPNTKADMIIEVEGDSMSSSYPAGSKVAIRKIQFDRQYPTVNIPFGEVFAIVIDNDDDNYLTFIKRLRRHPDKSLQNKFWIAQSDNAAYDDFEIEISKVRHLFIAVASIKLTGY